MTIRQQSANDAIAHHFDIADDRALLPQGRPACSDGIVGHHQVIDNVDHAAGMNQPHSDGFQIFGKSR